MKLLKDFMKAEKRHENVLALLFILYVVFNVETPQGLASYVDNIYGHIVVLVLALSLFMHANPVVGVLGLVVAYEFVRRSREKTGRGPMERYLPTEKNKCQQLNAMNQFPVTLEEEVVAKMVPIVKHAPPPNAGYKPVLDSTNSAAPL